MPSPNCTVNAQITDNGVNVDLSSVVIIQLANTSLVGLWSIRCVGTDDTSDADTITASLVINRATKTATFTAPSDNAKAFIFESKVNNGLGVGQVIDPTLTTTFGIYLPTSTGKRVIAFNERNENDAVFGWIPTVNSIIRSSSTPTIADPPMTGMKLWLQPRTGFRTLDGSGNVQALADKSGAGIVTSVSQSDPTKRFAVAIGPSGKPKLVGDGTMFLESSTSLFTSGVARTVVVIAEGTDGPLVTFRRSAPFMCLESKTITGLHYTFISDDGNGTPVKNRVNPSLDLSSTSCLEYRYTAGPLIPTLSVNGVQHPANSEINTDVDLSTSDTGAAGITIGGRADLPGSSVIGGIYEVLIWDHYLDSTEQTQLRLYLFQQYGISFAAASTKNRLVFDGDSITQGSGVGTFAETWPYLVQQTLGASTWDVADMGLQSTDAGACNIRYAKQCAPLFETIRDRNYLIILIGTNNLVAGGGAIDIYDLIKREVQKAVNPGTNFKVYVCTLTGRTDALWLASPTAATERLTLNTLIRENTALAHGIIDFTTNSTLDTAPSSHFPDGVHPNAAGNVLMASVASAKIAEVISMATFTGVQKWLHASAYNASTGVWTDASGLGNHFSQASVPARPTVTAAWRNGKPAVRTTVTTFLETSTNIGTAGEAFTEIFVGERIGANGGGIAQYRKTGVVCEASHLTVSSTHYIYSDAVAVNVLLAVSWDPTITANAFLSMWKFNGTGTQPSVIVGHADRPINVGASGNQTTESGDPGAFYGKTRTAGQEFDGNGAFSARIAGGLTNDLQTKMLSFLWDEWRV